MWLIHRVVATWVVEGWTCVRQLTGSLPCAFAPGDELRGSMPYHPVGSRGERGTTLVEFALLVPMLVVLLAGVLEIGRALDVWLVVTNAVREGARYAALSGRSPNPMYANDIQAVTYNYLVKGFAGRTDVQIPAPSEVQITGGLPFCYESKKGGCPPPVAPGSKVTVGVTVKMPILIPLVASFFPSNPAPVRGSMTVEVQ